MMGVVLCAGLGTRLRPLTDRVPKPLIEVAGRPMVHYPLGLLRAAGVTDIVLNAHYRADQLQAALGDGHRWGLRLRYSVEPRLLGTGGGLRHLLPLIDGERFLVLNADQITDVDLGALCESHRRRAAVATLAVVDGGETPTTYRRLVVRDGLLQRLATPHAAAGPIFTGVQVVERRLFQGLCPADPACIVRDFLLPAIAGGETVGACHHSGVWLDTGDRAALQHAEERLRHLPPLPALE
jgi:NDP-sugar pyrophosphorylase family protein